MNDEPAAADLAKNKGVMASQSFSLLGNGGNISEIIRRCIFDGLGGEDRPVERRQRKLDVGFVRWQAIGKDEHKRIINDTLQTRRQW